MPYGFGIQQNKLFCLFLFRFFCSNIALVCTNKDVSRQSPLKSGKTSLDSFYLEIKHVQRCSTNWPINSGAYPVGHFGELCDFCF